MGACGWPRVHLRGHLHQAGYEWSCPTRASLPKDVYLGLSCTLTSRNVCVMFPGVLSILSTTISMMNQRSTGSCPCHILMQKVLCGVSYATSFLREDSYMWVFCAQCCCLCFWPDSARHHLAVEVLTRIAEDVTLSCYITCYLHVGLSGGFLQGLLCCALQLIAACACAGLLRGLQYGTTCGVRLCAWALSHHHFYQP